MTGDFQVDVSSGRCRSTTRSAESFTARSTASLTINPPAGTTGCGTPPKVSTRAEPAMMPAPVSRSATCAAPMRSGAVPRLLDSTTRRRAPPTETRAICRSVWSLKWTADMPPTGSGDEPSPAASTAAGTSRAHGKASAAAGRVCTGWSTRATAGAAQVAIHRSEDDAAPTCAAGGPDGLVQAPKSSAAAAMKHRLLMIHLCPLALARSHDCAVPSYCALTSVAALSACVFPARTKGR